MNDMAFGIEWPLESSGGLRGCHVDGLNHELRQTLQNDDGATRCRWNWSPSDSDAARRLYGALLHSGSVLHCSSELPGAGSPSSSRRPRPLSLLLKCRPEHGEQRPMRAWGGSTRPARRTSRWADLSRSSSMPRHIGVQAPHTRSPIKPHCWGLTLRPRYVSLLELLPQARDARQSEVRAPGTGRPVPGQPTSRRPRGPSAPPQPSHRQRSTRHGGGAASSPNSCDRRSALGRPRQRRARTTGETRQRSSC